MTLSHINRRLHLYLGLALLPWFFMYGISSIPFAHTPFFERRDAAKRLPLWTLRAEKTFFPKRTRGLVMDQIGSLDIDDATDWAIAEAVAHAGLTWRTPN